MHLLRGCDSNRKIPEAMRKRAINGTTAVALCRVRSDAGQRAPGTHRPGGQPGDAAPMDECGGIVADPQPPREARACVAAAALLPG